MNAKNLSLSFIFFGLLLFGSAAFSFWVKSLAAAAWFFAAGFGIFTWAHFLNRRHYWGFTALIVQLFVMLPVLGWNILAYFRTKTTGAEAEVTETGFMLYSVLFLITLGYLLLSTKNATRIRQELQ